LENKTEEKRTKMNKLEQYILSYGLKGTSMSLMNLAGRVGEPRLTDVIEEMSDKLYNAFKEYYDNDASEELKLAIIEAAK
jgi:hypothetical protein